MGSSGASPAGASQDIACFPTNSIDDYGRRLRWTIVRRSTPKEPSAQYKHRCAASVECGDQAPLSYTPRPCGASQEPRFMAKKPACFSSNWADDSGIFPQGRLNSHGLCLACFFYLTRLTITGDDYDGRSVAFSP